MTGVDDFGQSLPIGAHHYRAYVGPPEKYDLVGAMQFNLLTHLGLREFRSLQGLIQLAVRRDRTD